MPTAETELQRGYVLHVSGAYDDVMRLTEEMELSFLDEEEKSGQRPFAGQLSFSEYGLAEVVISTPHDWWDCRSVIRSSDRTTGSVS